VEELSARSGTNSVLETIILRSRRARYDEFWALKGVSFEVPQGATFGVIGWNGSGKSTLLKCLTGSLYPEKGSEEISGRVSALLELGAGFHPELSGRVDVFLNGAILGLTKKEIERKFDDIVDFAGLHNFIDTPVKNYLLGMFVRLGFAVAAHVEPDVLLIDEVLSVGDESFQRRCAEKIDQFRRDGRTIVSMSHGLAQVAQLCETVAWIDKGNLKTVGKADDAIAQYLGDWLPVASATHERGSRFGAYARDGGGAVGIGLGGVVAQRVGYSDDRGGGECGGGLVDGGMAARFVGGPAPFGMARICCWCSGCGGGCARGVAATRSRVGTHLAGDGGVRAGIERRRNQHRGQSLGVVRVGGGAGHGRCARAVAIRSTESPSPAVSAG